MGPQTGPCGKCEFVTDLSFHLRSAVDELATSGLHGTDNVASLWALPFGTFDDRPTDCPLVEDEHRSLAVLSSCTRNLRAYLGNFQKRAPDAEEAKKSAGWICDACGLLPEQCQAEMARRYADWQGGVERLREAVG